MTLTLSLMDIFVIVGSIISANVFVAALMIRVATNGSCAERHAKLLAEILRKLDELR